MRLQWPKKTSAKLAPKQLARSDNYVLSEQSERKKRKLNVVCNGIPESNKDNQPDISEEDKSKIDSLFQQGSQQVV